LPSPWKPRIARSTLANLRLELIPENPLDAQSPEEDRQNASRAVVSLSFLERIAYSSYELPHVARYVVPLLLASLEGIICWSEITLDVALPYDYPQRDDFISRQGSIALTLCCLLRPGMDTRLLA
jgi:hypothetical protein